jgi:hypothetical protein
VLVRLYRGWGGSLERPKNFLCERERNFEWLSARATRYDALDVGTEAGSVKNGNDAVAV